MESTEKKAPKKKSSFSPFPALFGVACLVIIALLAVQFLGLGGGNISLAQAELQAENLMVQTTSAQATFSLEEVRREEGFYVVDYNVTAPGQEPFPQQLRFSLNGKYLIPEALVFEEVLQNIAEQQAAQQAATQPVVTPEPVVEEASDEAAEEVAEEAEASEDESSEEETASDEDSE